MGRVPHKRDMVVQVVRCLFAFVLLVLSSELGCSYTLTWKYSFIPLALVLAFLSLDLLLHFYILRRRHLARAAPSAEEWGEWGGYGVNRSSPYSEGQWSGRPWLLRVATRHRVKVGLNVLFYGLTVCGLILLFWTAEKFCEAESNVVAHVSVREAAHYPDDEHFEFVDGQVHRGHISHRALVMDNTTSALLPYLPNPPAPGESFLLLVAPVVPVVREWEKRHDPVGVWAYGFDHEPAEWEELELHQGSRAPAAVLPYALDAIAAAALVQNITLGASITVLNWTEVEDEIMYKQKTGWYLVTGVVMYLGLVLIALALPAYHMIEVYYSRRRSREEEDRTEGQYLLQEFRIIIPQEQRH